MFSQRMCLLVVRQNFFINLINRNKHVYKTSPLSLAELQNCLKRSARFKDGLIFVNKPVGVCYSRGLVNAESLSPGSDVSIQNALPSIKELFNVGELFNVKIPERNISGTTIFSDSKTCSDDVKLTMRRMRERNEMTDIYHAIVIGKPVYHTHQFDGSISLQTKNGVTRPVLSEKISRSAVKRGDAKLVTLSYKTLATNGEASLLEIHSTRSKFNCVRVYLATQTLTPVLGDYIYGTYVKRILGSAVPVDVFNKTLLPQQKLPEALSQQLNLIGRKDIIIPLHLHLSTVKIFRKKGKFIELTTSFPETFQWTIDNLGLHKEPLALASSS